MKCAVTGCPSEGTEQPVFRFPRMKDRADAKDEKDKVVPSVKGRLFGIVVCAEHGTATTEEILTDATWARIVEAYERVGFPVPSRASIILGYEHMVL